MRALSLTLDRASCQIRHVYTYDTRPDVRMPTAGVLLRNTLELAGLGGDVRFFKHTLEAQVHQSIRCNLTRASADLACKAVCSCFRQDIGDWVTMLEPCNIGASGPGPPGPCRSPSTTSFARNQSCQSDSVHLTLALRSTTLRPTWASH